MVLGICCTLMSVLKMKSSWTTQLFFTTHIIGMSISKMLKTWVYSAIYATPPKICQNDDRVRLHSQMDCNLWSFLTFPNILHTNCIWDVNNSIMCLHHRWLDAVFPIEAFCSVFWFVSGNHFIIGHWLCYEADMSCLNYSIKNMKVVNMCVVVRSTEKRFITLFGVYQFIWW